MGWMALAAAVVPGTLRLGPLQVPTFGVFAAGGLILALWVSQRTAKFVGIEADKLWDVGVTAILVAFVASRLLLIVQDPVAFRHYPMLLMSLPSLTYGGMVLTVLVTWAVLRRKKIPVLDAMDAWAPCGALLAAMLSVGHYVEGTGAGMPTRLPWGVVTRGDSVLGKTHPVQLYALVAALGMCEWLMIRLKYRKRAGEVAGLALVVGGAISFGLDMLRQPWDSVRVGWWGVLDPSQWVALGMVVAGGILVVKISSSVKEFVATEPVGQEELS